MANDMEILKRAHAHENDPRRYSSFKSWEAHAVGADRAAITRLMDNEYITLSYSDYRVKKYKLTDKGQAQIFASTMETKMERISYDTLMDAFSVVVGWDDIKDSIAKAIANGRRINYLLEGPPASGKSVIMDVIRDVVPGAVPVFGSRVSASGLSDILFDHKPKIITFDEIEKAHRDAYSVLLALMEKGDVQEAKTGKTRGVQLECMVIAACNSSDKLPPENRDRFKPHLHFPEYTRDQFVEVSERYLARAESCPPEISRYIGELVFDRRLGSIRACRSVWQQMYESSTAEVDKVIEFMLRYQPQVNESRKKRGPVPQTARLL